MKITAITVRPALVWLSLSLISYNLVAFADPGAAAVKAAASADPDQIAESKAPLPAFPYLDYPSTVDQAFQTSEASPLDRVYVIAGNKVRQLEGRISMRTFPNDQSAMSEVELRQHYEGVIRGFGGVKVNTVAPDDAALVALNGGDELDIRKNLLRIPEVSQSYDVFLVRKDGMRHWMVLMLNGRTTRLLAVEEQDFVQTIGYVAEGGKTSPVRVSGAPPMAPEPVQPDAVPLSAQTLPPFPYLAYPPKLDPAYQENTGPAEDAAYIIVGKQLRAVKGTVQTRTFPNSNADMSAMALRRNYEAAIKGLGGVKVNHIGPEARTLAANGEDEKAVREIKLRVPERDMRYDSYLIRTAQGRIWIALMGNERRTRLLTIAEPVASPMSAEAMRKEIADQGRVALYLNFDTDQARIRADGAPAINEIISLLKNDAVLKLAIEGHTDNQGDARHNQTLSTQRAQAVAAALAAGGIDPGRLRASGFGADKPIANNGDERGRAKNRRVELVKLSAD